MEQLNTYITEGLFKNVGIGSDAIKAKIENWIKENCYIIENLSINYVDGKWIADAEKIAYTRTAKQMTNGEFEWGKVDYVNCSINMESLVGGPRTCIEFFCAWTRIKNLEGAPDECESFYCHNCDKLTSLKGAEKMKCEDFDCENCINLIDFKGCPDTLNRLDCSGCYNIESLKGFPKKVDIIKFSHAPQFTRDDVEKVCRVKKIIGMEQ